MDKVSSLYRRLKGERGKKVEKSFNLTNKLCIASAKPLETFTW
jgi:hypothetical protein